MAPNIVNKRLADTARPKSKARTDDKSASATLRHARLSPRKVRIALNMVRKMPVKYALQALQTSPRKGSKLLLKLIESAMYNAKETKGLNIDALYVSAGWVDMGRTLKRFMPRAQGRATTIKKRSSHITVVLRESEV